MLLAALFLSACAPASTPSPEESQQVSAVVEGIGSKLQLVSLLSPTAAEDIKTQYAGYVSTDLLDQWAADPSKAPGRLTSSPWPDHIDIHSITKSSSDTVLVKGEIVELTSVEVNNGGSAATVPVQITLEQDSQGKWWITAWKQEGQ